MKNYLTTLLLSLSLMGCSQAESGGPPKRGTVEDLRPITTPGFEGCVFGDLWYSEYTTIRIVRCPTTVSTNYPSGKSTIQTMTIDDQTLRIQQEQQKLREALSRISPEDRKTLGLDK